MKKHFEKVEETSPSIPTSTTSDIVFLLLIFFMVTTVFRTEQGLRIDLPQALSSKKIETKNLAHVWIGYDGDRGVVSIDDRIVPIGQIKNIIEQKKRVNPNLIVSIMADKNTPYWISNDVFGQLIKANALHVSLSAKKVNAIK
ncbi:MAG: biopolymer transporter ExbD [candidate division WOR-3 bacterium]